MENYKPHMPVQGDDETVYLDWEPYYSSIANGDDVPDLPVLITEKYNTKPEEPTKPTEETVSKDSPKPKEPTKMTKAREPREEGECMSPTPSGEELPEGETDKIITQTKEILQFCQDKVDIQKIDSHSLAFMLLRIRENLDAYSKGYIPKLNAFLVGADQITAEYYAYMCNNLPKYGDYVKAIEADTSDKIDVGNGIMVYKSEVLELVKGITDNYYAEALFLKSGRSVLRDINCNMNERWDIVTKINAPMPQWMEIQDNVTAQLENIREQTFKIAAYVDFLKQGETKTGTALDLSQLMTP